MTEISKEFINHTTAIEDIKTLATIIQTDLRGKPPITCLVAVTRGGLYPTAILSQLLNIRDIRTISLRSYENNSSGKLSLLQESTIQDSCQTLFIDDLCDSGQTLEFLRLKYPKSLKAVVYTKDISLYKLRYDYYSKIKDKDTWLVFPWELPELPPLTNLNIQPKTKEIAKWEPRPDNILPWEDTPTISQDNFIQEVLEEIKQEEESIGFKPIPFKEETIISRRYTASHNEKIDIDKDYRSNEGYLLSREQKKVINWIENKRSNLTLLTGKAGAGKSAIIKELLFRNPSWNICSTTGRSALLVGGCTVDRLFAYDRDTNTHFNEYVLLSNMRSFGKVVIIDEASMMGKKMFDVCYKACIRFHKDLVLVGDWGQAAPVKDDWVFNSQLFLRDAQCIKLTDAHRQTNQEFLEVLDKIRRGIVDDQVNTLMKSRILPQLDENDNSKVVIYSTNTMTASYNQKKVHQYAEDHDQQIITLISIATKVKEEIPEEKVQFNLENSPYANGEEICLGCKVLITRNNLTEGYVNGDTGILKEISEKELVIVLDRTNYTVRVRYETTDIKDSRGVLEMKISGFPIKCGYAFTAHKCQGLTIPKVWVDISDIKRLRCHGLCYVALSRVRNLEDLYISNWDPEAVRCDDITKPYL